MQRFAAVDGYFDGYAACFDRVRPRAFTPVHYTITGWRVDDGVETSLYTVVDGEFLPTRYTKTWNGTAWVTHPVKTWGGAAWTQRPVSGSPSDEPGAR